MGDCRLNCGYFCTNRGLIKILQIIVGFLLCSLLCGTWVGGRNCFNEGRIGTISAFNFVVLIINIVFFVLNFLNILQRGLERLYSLICFLLFLAATGVLAWTIVQYRLGAIHVSADVLLAVQFLLFLWDVKILGGQASN